VVILLVTGGRLTRSRIGPFVVFWSSYLDSLLVYLPNWLGQKTAKWPLRCSSQAATCFYRSINHSKVEAILLRTLPKDTTSEIFGLSSHPFLMLRLRSTDYEADALSTWPRAGK